MTRERESAVDSVDVKGAIYNSANSFVEVETFVLQSYVEEDLGPDGDVVAAGVAGKRRVELRILNSLQPLFSPVKSSSHLSVVRGCLA
jgi:hypothetical protein